MEFLIVSGLSGGGKSRGDKMYYLLVAEKDSAVDSNDKLILDNSTYEVIKCQSYMYQNKCMYKWAILKLCYPILEDDFSGNS